MKANELRIGNYVTWKDEESNDAILTVTGIVLNDCVWVEWEWEDGEKDYTECDFDGLKPILITEDWLIKLGFVYHEPLIYGKSGWYLKIPNQDFPSYIFANNYLHIALFISSKFNNSFIDTNINYINQLQNLHFALTGEELTIKE
jgi:hypothetical protein